MNEMIERVGRALAKAYNYAYDPYPYDDWAKAAIEAMRKPTEAMKQAGFDNNYQRYADAAFTAMIDAALTPASEAIYPGPVSRLVE